jgi:gp16 family phage-associated protein
MALSPTTSSLQTPSEVRQWFFEHGISVTDWARKNGFRRDVVYAALAGRTRGYRGQAHAVALALGLKIRSTDMVGSAHSDAQRLNAGTSQASLDIL